MTRDSEWRTRSNPLTPNESGPYALRTMRPFISPSSIVAVSLLALVCSFGTPALALPFIGGGGGKVSVTIAAAANCNDCGSGTASALKVRVFAVADEAGIRTVLNNKTVGWSKQLEAAGANVLGKPAEEFVAPGTTRTFVVVRDAKATVIVVEGNFCKRVGAAWYYVHPARQKKLKLTAGSTGFSPTTGK